MKQPCLKCLRARKRLRDLAALVTGQRGNQTLVEMTNVDLVLDRKNNIVNVSHSDFDGYVGIKVYLSGRQLIQDIHPSRVLVELGFIRRASRID